MVKKSETETKTKAKEENSTFIVNSLLFFMNQRHKSKVLDSTFQMMLNYYNVETISEAKALLHNKIAPETRFIKRKGVGKARETLEDIHGMIVELDADPNNSLRLVTENTDFLPLIETYWCSISLPQNNTVKQGSRTTKGSEKLQMWWR